MEEVVEALRAFFMDVYLDQVVPLVEEGLHQKFDEVPLEQVPALGFVVGGFSSHAYLSEVWEILVPIHNAMGQAIRHRSEGEFGTNWFATFDPIRRYILGFDPDLLNAVIAYTESLQGRPYSPDEVEHLSAIVQRHEYQIPYGAMPMKEGLDHVRFLVELVINHHRYAVGAPIVGGKARIGMVTYRGEQFQIVE